MNCRCRVGASGICDELPKIIQSFSIPSIQNISPLKSALNPTGIAVEFNQELADELVVWAVRAIADLAANNPNNQTKLGMTGCCEALVTVLNSAVESLETNSLGEFTVQLILIHGCVIVPSYV